MITKILLFNTEHEAAEGLQKLQSSGIPSSSISVLVSNVEHSRLLNSETDIHVDLFSEMTAANRREHGTDAADERGGQASEEGQLNGLVVPVYAQQPSMQVPVIAFSGLRNGFDQSEQGIPTLLSYGISEENAERCLHALRAGQCIVCVSDQGHSSYDDNRHLASSSLELGFSSSEVDGGLLNVGAAEVLNNRG